MSPIVISGSRAARFLALLLGSVAGLIEPVPGARAETVVTPRLTLAHPDSRDQDDMCVWIHPVDKRLSTIITSDKDAQKLFVYDLQGATLQVVSVAGQPGNIDIRYKFPLGGTTADIVAVNDRTNRRIQVYRVNAGTRQLVRVDGGTITTGPNYGICLYRSAAGPTYAFTTSENGAIEQWRLQDQAGQVVATRVRNWSYGSITEGCVCDDETGQAYFGEERVGIWKVDANPAAPYTGSLIAAVGDASGLAEDVEGLTIYYAAGGQGYLIASSQGINQFKVYRRKAPHAYVGTFAVSGVTGTDGIDVTNVALGPQFPAGLFAVHNRTPVEVNRYQDLGLSVDTTYWDPRRGSTVAVEPAPPSGLVLRVEYPRDGGVPTLVCTLPDARPASLEVFDVAGRRVESRSIASLGPGTHRLALAPETALRAGLYLVRLGQGLASLAAKAFVMR